MKLYGCGFIEMKNNTLDITHEWLKKSRAYLKNYQIHMLPRAFAQAADELSDQIFLRTGRAVCGFKMADQKLGVYLKDVLPG